jgi:NADPH:quinone reductase-like Zn-dependent oxidoreductase
MFQLVFILYKDEGIIKMKAVIYEEYGPPEVLQLVEIAKPVPKENEILIKIHATSVSAGDWRMRKPEPFAARLYNGLFKPRRVKVLGYELSGEVEAIGESVRRFKVGEPVFGFTGFGFGAYAEYICLPEDRMIVTMPVNATFEEAAAGLASGGLTALVVLRKANISKEQKVLVYGASGSVGTYAVQIARYFGAEVTGVCSGTNLPLVTSLGAEHVIDYTKEEFPQDGVSYDVVFDSVDKFPYSCAKACLKETGIYLNVNKHSGSEKNLKIDDLLFLKMLVEEGYIQAVIDRRYSLDQIVEAHRYVESGHKTGSVVITVRMQ